MNIRRYRVHFTHIASVLLMALVWLSTAEAQQGRVIQDMIHSTSLEGNLLGDPATRPITIYLPPSYDEGEDPYPVVYYLHAYSQNNNMWVDLGIHSAMDSLIEQGKVQEMIVVMPDGFNRYGGSIYANSSVAGNYEDYIAKELVQFIDSKYRILPQRESRAIGGGSMGASGAMRFAIKHPDIFCAVASHSGIYSLDGWKDDVCANPNAKLGGYPIHHAQAIAFSPNPNKPPLYFDYPADYNGDLIEDIWQRWLEHDIVILARTHPNKLRQLTGIYFDHGKSDTTVNVANAREFDRTLTEMDIPHVYEEYAGGHSDQWRSRLYIALPYISDLLSPEMLVGVESMGKLATIWASVKAQD